MIMFKFGRWQIFQVNDNKTRFICTKCNGLFDVDEPLDVCKAPKVCPECGAKMLLKSNSRLSELRIVRKILSAN